MEGEEASMMLVLCVLTDMNTYSLVLERMVSQSGVRAWKGNIFTHLKKLMSVLAK